jgi:type IV secretory pathway TrbL component
MADLRRGFAASLRRAVRPVNWWPSIATLCALPAERYIKAMEGFLPILIVLAMLATLGVLLFGIINMAKGGNPQRSNKLMQLRIWMQGLALLLFVIFMLMYHHR